MPLIELQHMLATALQAAEAARALILSYYHGEFDVEIKADQTPVTVADREAGRVRFRLAGKRGIE